MVAKLIYNLGQSIISYVQKFGDVALHLYLSFYNIRPFRFKQLAEHIEFVGNKSFFIIFLTGISTGFVISHQAWLGLSFFDAESIIGTVSSISIFREVSPVMTGIILSARAGGAMSARLGAMVVSDEISAIEVMGLNSKNYLVTPRILASIISAPLLSAIFSLSAIVGCYILAAKINQLDQAIFWNKTLFWLNPRDIIEGIVKSSIFGLLFATICTYTGLNTKSGAKGVGDSTNQGIVASIVCIIVSDFFISKFIAIFWDFI